jgi:hypothetical protein
MTYKDAIAKYPMLTSIEDTSLLAERHDAVMRSDDDFIEAVEAVISARKEVGFYKMKIEVEQAESFDLFVTLLADDGVFKQPDGSVKLWWKPF